MSLVIVSLNIQADNALLKYFVQHFGAVNTTEENGHQFAITR